MRIISYIAALFVCLAVNANAQTFATDSGLSDTVKAPDNEAAIAPANTPNAAEKKAQTEDDEDNMMQDATVNIGDAQKKPDGDKYDNSVGRVFEYKIVDGNIVFADDDDRKILVYYENFKVTKGMDNLVRCSMRIYVLNDLKERINNLSFKLLWPEINTTIQMVRLNPGVRTYQDIMLLGEGCFSMDKTPTIEINRCRVKGKTEEQCADAVKWFKKSN
jgi:hypothetical protein